MEWKKSFEVGIPEIDKQHMIIVECINALQNAVDKREGKSGWSTVHSVLGQLAAYARMHFASEEVLMRHSGYPRVDEHADEHLQFVNDLQILQGRSLTNDITHELLAFLDTWWQEHIMERDMQYVPFLTTAPVKERLE